MAQLDNTTLMGIFVAIIGVYAMFSKFLMGRKNGNVTKVEFEEHKKTVQYKDNCGQTVERIEQNITAATAAATAAALASTALLDEKIKNIEEGIARIENHVKRN